MYAYTAKIIFPEFRCHSPLRTGKMNERNMQFSSFVNACLDVNQCYKIASDNVITREAQSNQSQRPALRNDLTLPIFMAKNDRPKEPLSLLIFTVKVRVRVENIHYLKR